MLGWSWRVNDSIRLKGEAMDKSEEEVLRADRDKLLEVVITTHDMYWTSPRTAVGGVASHHAGELPDRCETCKLVSDIRGRSHQSSKR